MEVYRDLRIKGAAEALQRFMTDVEQRLDKGWSRNRAREQELSRLLPPAGYCFSRQGSNDAPPVNLHLDQRPYGLEVSNIVPTGDVQSISRTQYNDLLQEFFKFFLDPLARVDPAVTVDMSASQLEISDVLTRESAEALTLFCANANRAILHPLDRDRWLKFLIAVHRDPGRDNLYRDDILDRWLTEAHHFPDEMAEDLVRQVAFAEDLLEAYDRAS